MFLSKWYQRNLLDKVPIFHIDLIFSVDEQVYEVNINWFSLLKKPEVVLLKKEESHQLDFGGDHITTIGYTSLPVQAGYENIFQYIGLDIVRPALGNLWNMLCKRCKTEKGRGGDKREGK